MRSALLTAAIVALLGCTQNSPVKEGPQGPQGEPGPVGPTGPQGEQGPPGEVVTVDGGVIVGPPGPQGASVVVTPIAPGATCPSGGVRVAVEGEAASSIICNGEAGATGPAGPQGAPGANVQVGSYDGGVCPQGGVAVWVDGGTPQYVCHGAAGLQGPAGPAGATGPAGPQGIAGPQGAQGATGAVGATGPQGPAGTSVVATLLPQGDTNCPYGGTRFTLGTVITYACHGEPGSVGPPGAPAPGDGGYLGALTQYTFAGFTSATYTGNLGGIVGANAKCDAELPGAHLCTTREYQWAGASTSVPTGGAWIDAAEYGSQYAPNMWPRDREAAYTCNSWRSNATGEYATYLDESGYRAGTNQTCGALRPLACCRSNVAVFRGFTSGTYAGNLGGIVGANGKCHAAFAGSHMCTTREYQWAGSPAPVPVGGAWIDAAEYGSQYSPNMYPRDREAAYTCNSWRSSAPGEYATYLDESGYRAGTNQTCGTLRPIACCG